jgi:hypothetical protein
MAYLLSELIQYAIEKASNTNELEDRWALHAAAAVAAACAWECSG